MDRRAMSGAVTFVASVGVRPNCSNLSRLPPWTLPIPMTESIRSSVGTLITHSLLLRIREKLWFSSQMNQPMRAGSNPNIMCQPPCWLPLASGLGRRALGARRPFMQLPSPRRLRLGPQRLEREARRERECCSPPWGWWTFAPVMTRHLSRCGCRRSDQKRIPTRAGCV
jgi:hypothetical protein